ncbi:cylicin-2-like [Dermacentor albipictus]|uniref:cylicin-2-like n=1 Tax=Dermacentor albipictus TaxID=60249 RepID=UPI0031FE02C0
MKVAFVTVTHAVVVIIATELEHVKARRSNSVAGAYTPGIGLIYLGIPRKDTPLLHKPPQSWTKKAKGPRYLVGKPGSYFVGNRPRYARGRKLKKLATHRSGKNKPIGKHTTMHKKSEHEGKENDHSPAANGHQNGTEATGGGNGRTMDPVGMGMGMGRSMGMGMGMGRMMGLMMANEIGKSVANAAVDITKEIVAANRAAQALAAAAKGHGAADTGEKGGADAGDKGGDEGDKKDSKDAKNSKDGAEEGGTTEKKAGKDKKESKDAKDSKAATGGTSSSDKKSA